MSKKLSIPFITAVVISFLLVCFCTSFRPFWNSPVKGSVSPGESATRAWIFAPGDTLNAPVMQDNFIITNVKPGNYTLLVQGKPPYKDSFKENIVVVDGQPTDVGVIQMNK